MRTRIYHTFYGILILFIFLIISCNEWYNHTLGNHLSLWEGDKKEDKIIVYCEGSCHGGIYVIPTYGRHYDSSKQHYAEFVEAAKSNKKWVIVKTIRIKENQENYWFINKDFNIENVDCTKVNCDSILQSHVIGPLSLKEFRNKVKELKIGLDFN